MAVQRSSSERASFAAGHAGEVALRVPSPSRPSVVSGIQATAPFKPSPSSRTKTSPGSTPSTNTATASGSPLRAASLMGRHPWVPSARSVRSRPSKAPHARAAALSVTDRPTFLAFSTSRRTCERASE
jgi:hypothetical protein